MGRVFVRVAGADMFGIDLSAVFGRLFGTRKGAGKPVWGRQSPIELLALTLARNPEGWLVEPQRILRNGVEISWQGPLTNASAIRVKMDGKKYPVMSSEALALREALRGLLADRREPVPKSDIAFFGGAGGSDIDATLGRAPRRPRLEDDAGEAGPTAR